MSAVLRGLLLLLLPFLSLAFLPAAHAAQVPVPALSAWVTDQTGTLDSNTRTHLNTVLADLEKRKGAQIAVLVVPSTGEDTRSEEHTSELQSLVRISYAVFCLKKKKKNQQIIDNKPTNNKPYDPTTEYTTMQKIS